MKNAVLLLTFACSLGFSGLQAQKARTQYGEYGIGVGTLNMTSEIANSPTVGATFEEMRPQLTVFAKYHFNDWIGFGADINYGSLHAKDQNHNDPKRGYAVTTEIMHSNAFLEAHFIRFGKYRYDRKFTIFAKGGLGIAAWNPELEEWPQKPEDIDIETDGYAGFTYFGGLGCKFRIGYRSILTLEGRYHDSGGRTLGGITRVLEDGETADNDTFWGVSLSYSYAIF